jgi:GT2 family glycosyltransferase
MKWSLCIATLNRQEVLLQTLAYAVRQTCPPSQVVVVDVSDNWQEGAVKAAAVFKEYPDIVLDYRTSAVRSSATQRNLGLTQCHHDIVFMIDDDSFMYQNCAEEILKIYKADTANEVACIGAKLAPDLPPSAQLGGGIKRKSSGRRGGNRVRKTVLQSRFGRWFNRKVLLQNADELFLKYDEPRSRTVPDSVADLAVETANFMPGSAMTVRRDVALREPFDTALRYYAAFEDLDAAYRYARHGTVLRANHAYVHHFEAAGGRIKRKKVIVFQLLNMLVFLKRHARHPEDWIGRYRILMWRRFFGEVLKDALSGRITFPQAYGVLMVMRHWRKVWAQEVSDLDDWYPEFQKKIMEDL